MSEYELDEVYAILDVLERVEKSEGITNTEATLKHKPDKATRKIAKDAKLVSLDLTKAEKDTYRDVLVAYPEY